MADSPSPPSSPLMSFSNPLEPIKELFTEEGPLPTESPSDPFSSNVKRPNMTASHLRDSAIETPMFGDRLNSDSTSDLFNNFLCNTELSTQKKEPIFPPKTTVKSAEITKNILKELELSKEDKIIIKIQTRWRQFLAIRKVEEMRKRKFINERQKKLENNKQKVEALRVISQLWIVFKEAKRMAQAWKYLDEERKEVPDEVYFHHCGEIKYLKLMEGFFRKRLFRKVRVYLKTIPYEWRQSYVKLIDWRIYQREVNNKLKFVQKMRQRN
jgi:antitoxin component of MazEF toxin-antitoxin module